MAEEIELQSQRDAAVEVCKALKAEFLSQQERYEQITDAAEIKRIQAELEIKRINRELEMARTSSDRVKSMVFRWWIGGVVLGWVAAAVITYMVSPVLGYPVVLPCFLAGLAIGFARVRSNCANLKEHVPSYEPDKIEFMNAIGGAALDAATDEPLIAVSHETPSLLTSTTNGIGHIVGGGLAAVDSVIGAGLSFLGPIVPFLGSHHSGKED